MTSGGNGNVIAAPTSQCPPSTITSHGNHSLSCSQSVIACQTTGGGSGRYRSSRTAGLDPVVSSVASVICSSCVPDAVRACQGSPSTARGREQATHRVPREAPGGWGRGGAARQHGPGQGPRP